MRIERKIRKVWGLNNIVVLLGMLTCFSYIFFLTYIFIREHKVQHETTHSLGQLYVGRRKPQNLTRKKTHPICSNAKKLIFQDTEVFESAYQELEKFHNGGGNLKTIEKFLNDNMDSTLKLLGATFTPEGSKDPIPSDISTTNEIKNLYVKKDEKNKRGGYDQHNYPGQYNTHPSIKALLRPRFDVIESEELRWVKGLGPIHNLCHHLDKIAPVTARKKKKIEEKFMCSYPGRDIHGDDANGIKMNMKMAIDPSVKLQYAHLPRILQ